MCHNSFFKGGFDNQRFFLKIERSLKLDEHIRIETSPGAKLIVQTSSVQPTVTNTFFKEKHFQSKKRKCLTNLQINPFRKGLAKVKIFQLMNFFYLITTQEMSEKFKIGEPLHLLQKTLKKLHFIINN